MNSLAGRPSSRFAGVLLLASSLVFAAPALPQEVNSDAPATVARPVEQGKFTLHKFEQPIGEETYTISSDGDALAVNMEFKFTDRGAAVPLSATFRSNKDWSPLAFEIKGKNSRSTFIDEAVEVNPTGVRVRDREKWTEAAKPQQFFTIAGYAPTTMQMLMVRYWATHGSPAQLTTLPTGTVKIEPRGQDVIKIDGKDQTLDRYTVEGLIWGRESLWFDSNRNLVAAVTIDAEFDHFEAIREGYESGLGQFVGRAGTDGMAALAELSKGISGSHADTIALVGGTLIDGTSAAPVPDSVVVIAKGRILAAGPKSSVKIPHGAQKIDVHGKFILPGLWDMHAHFEQVEWGPIYLAAGATTVRDCGNEFEFITAVRDAVASGQGLGPRLELAGIVDGTGPLAIGVARVDTPEEAKMWVDKYHDAGFQQMNRRGVSKYVRGNSLRLAVGTVLDYWFSVSPHEFVNTKSCQGTSLTRGENRVLAAGAGHLIQKTTQECRSLGPQRTIAPLVALPMQMHPWVWTELKIRGAKVGDLLHTRTSVVEKQQ